MRATSVAATLALLLLGCGFEPAPTGPEDPELASPEPTAPLPGPEFAAATAPANLWSTQSPNADARVPFSRPAW
jgi:hypothetical protein